jgi:hypothetical protein
VEISSKETNKKNKMADSGFLNNEEKDFNNFRVSQLKMSDTRQLRIGSHDAISGTISPNGSGFEIDLGNVIQQIGQDVVGYSTESVGFYNLHPLVDLGTSNSLVISFNQQPGVLVSLPEINYGDEGKDQSIAEYVAETLQAAIIAQTGEIITVVANEDTSTFTFETPLTEFRIGAEGEITQDANNRNISTNALSKLLGLLGPQPWFQSSPGLLGSYSLQSTQWDFGGERVAFLHSSLLAHDKTSVDAEGVQMSSFCSVPITVGYGNYNQAYPNQYQTMAVFWGRKHMIRNVNFRLRTVRGGLLNLKNTEFYMVLRLFLSPK